jgi:hypothetical protein
LENANGTLYVPPRIGSPHLALKQVRLSRLVVDHFRENATDLSRWGSVRITDAEWTAMAKKVGFTNDFDVGKLIARWEKDPHAFLARKGSDRFALAPAHRRAHATLLAGAKKSIDGARRKASGDRRAKAKAA